jgi:membrane-anchored glycerophosphoryl diester phosphodiesterase (GDPDase)
MMVMFFTCVQIVSFIWYVLSYIPFARTVIKTIYNRTCSFLGLFFRRSS